METLASCGSPLSSGPPITEAPAGRPGQPPSRTQRRRVQRRAQYQRLKDGPAWQTAREVRRVVTEFQKSPAPGPRTQFQNDELASISPINLRIAHQHHTLPMHATVLAATYRPTPIHHALLQQCSIASGLGGTVALAVNNPVSCIPEIGTDEAAGSAHRCRYGDPPHRVPSCLSSCEHDKFAANVDNCIIEADPSVLVPFCFIGSDNGRHIGRERGRERLRD